MMEPAMSNASQMCSPAMFERQSALDALKATPEGLQEIARIFRKVVLLPGDFLPPGIPVDHMISDIVDVEFKRL
jgi:hypothetical protein